MEPQPSETTLQPAPPLVPPKPKNNSFLIILLSVLLLLATSLAFFFALQTQKLAKQLAQYQSAIPSPTPTASQAPTGDLANWETYTSPEFNFSFKYPTENSLQATEFDVKNDHTALKPDREFWVAYPSSDVIVLSLFLYRSNLSAQEWWNTRGISKYNQLVTDFYNVVNPKPPTLNLPKFVVSMSSIAEEPAAVAKGYVDAAQRGDSIISVVSYKGWIYMFEQLNPLPDNKALNISNQILSTFKFLD